MANSGSFNTSAYSDRYITFNWSLASQDIGRNLTYINWEIRGAGGSTGKWYKSGNFKVVVDGEVVYNSANRIELYNGTVIASGQKMMAHHTDGHKSFSASVEAGIYTVAVNVSGSGSWDLPNIPKSVGISSAADFNDEGNPIIYFNNPGGLTLNVWLEPNPASTHLCIRNNIPNAGSYTWSLSEAERNQLRAACKGKSCTIRYGMYAYSGSTLISTAYIDKTFKIVNGEPTLSPTVVDSNATTIALTGNKNKLVRYYSNAQVNSGAAARKQATIKSQSVVGGGKAISSGSGTLTGIVNNVFTFTATDSRGLSTTKVVEPDMVEYVKLTCNLSSRVQLVDESLTKVNFTIKGKCFGGSFGAVKNTLEIGYRYKINDGAYGDWVYTTVQLNDYDDTYEATFSFNDSNYKNYYTFECYATDKLATVKSGEIIVRAKPVFDWSGDDFAVNVPMSLLGSPIADFVVESGTDGMWSYRKWASGAAECWGRTERTSASVTSAWGSIYIADNAIPQEAYPFTFVENPIVSSSLYNYSGNCWLYTGTPGSTKVTPSYGIARGTSSSTVAVSVEFNVKGRWKI